jgi:hypothetical protein
MLFGVSDEITNMMRCSRIVWRSRFIYGIIVFGLRKGSGIHQKGFWMFPEMIWCENTLFGPRGKAHEVFGKCKRKFCRDQRPDARVPGIWAQTPGTLASGPGVREGLLPFGQNRL